MGKRSKISVKNKVKFSDAEYNSCIRKEKYSNVEQASLEAMRHYDKSKIMLSIYDCRVCNGLHLTSGYEF